MTRIRFEDLPSTNTPRNAENLNKLNNVVISPTEPTTGEEVWIQKGKNLFDIRKLRQTSSNGLTYTPNVNNNSINVTGTPTGYSSCVLMEKFKPKRDFIVSLNGQMKNTTNMMFEAQLYKDGKYVRAVSGDYAISLNEYDFDYCDISLKRNNNVLTDENIQVLVSYEDDPTFEAYVDKKIYTKNDNGVYEEFYKEVEDTGWIEIPLNSGITCSVHRMRRIGKQVFIDIKELQGWTSGSAFASVPSEFQKTQTEIFSAFTTDGVELCRISQYSDAQQFIITKSNGATNGEMIYCQGIYITD